MPYKTIQQNFANGELNPKMQGRSDVDMYYKSAQKMRDVVTTPYGGFVRRPGTTKIGDLTGYYKTQGEKDVRLIPFVFNNDQSYLLALTEGKIDVFQGDNYESTLNVPLFTNERLKNIKFAQSADTCFFAHSDFSPLKLVRSYASPTLKQMQIQGDRLLPKGIETASGTDCALETNAFFSVTSGQNFELNLSAYIPTTDNEIRVDWRMSNIFYLGIASTYLEGYQRRDVFITMYHPGVGSFVHHFEESQNTENIRIKLKREGANNYSFSYSLNGGAFVVVKEFTTDVNASFVYENPSLVWTGKANGGSYIKLSESNIYISGSIFWNYETSNNARWTMSDFQIESQPTYNFSLQTEKKVAGKTTAKPDNLDGVVKITLGTGVTDNLVGQFFEGNGARVKITSQNGATLTGYTVIGFYSTDEIKSGAWTYTTEYEPVWSNTRGWPCSVTFHQGRLWFGGSKSRPQTVWGSKVGMFNKFDPTSGYDNDAIEFTLDTADLNKITDIYSMRNLLIFTTGGEFACQTSYNEPITPKNVNATKQTSNGSWENTQPVDMEGSVIFVEHKGQALMNFAYLGDEAYNSNNASLINSHLINQPEDLDVERNNLTQQTNYVYIVNKDGSMCVVNLLAAQGITGGFTLWNTQGKVKSVCVLPDATYVAVEREVQGNYKKYKIFLEKLDWDVLTDCTQSFSYAGGIANSIPGDHTDLMLKDVDIIANGKYLCSATVSDTGTLKATKTFPAGTISWGYPFRSYVQSNFLEVAQMGSGVGKLKRLASMVVRVLDTPEVTINGETQKGTGKGVEDIHFYGIGDWDEKPTWEFTQNTPYKFNVLAAQMDLNYQLSTESY